MENGELSVRVTHGTTLQPLWLVISLDSLVWVCITIIYTPTDLNS